MTEVTSSAPLLLEDGESVWIVVRGTLQVFAAPFADGEPAGPRYFLMEQGEGGALFSGAAPPAAASPGGVAYRLMASPVDGATLIRYRRAELPGPGLDPDSLAMQIDRWIEGLSRRRSAGSARPRRWFSLSPGRGWLVADGQGAISESGVLWCCHPGDRSRFLSSGSIPMIEGETTVPLCPGTWITPLGVAAVTALPTQDLLRHGDIWQHLDHFHRLILELTTQEVTRERQEANERVLARRGLDSQEQGRTFSRIMETFGAPEDSRPLESADPLWASCRLVWRATGIEPPAEEFPLEDSGADHATRLAETVGIRIRAVTLTEDWWSQDGGPLLGSSVEGGRPLALLPFRGGYQVVDPLDGRPQAVDRARATQISPRAYTFHRSFAPVPLTWPGILQHGLRGSGLDPARILAYSGAAAILGCLPSLVSRELVDVIVPGADRQRLVEAGFALLAAAACAILFEIVRMVALVRLQGRLGASLQSAMMDRLLNLPMGFFRGYSAGELADRAISVNQIRELLSGAAVTSFLGAISAAAGSVMLVYFSPRLALIAFLCLASLFAFSGLITVLRVRSLRNVTRRAGKLQGLVLQLITGVMKLKVSGAENRAFHRWSTDFVEQLREQLRSDQLAAAGNVLTATFPILSTLLLFVFTAQFALQDAALPPVLDLEHGEGFAVSEFGPGSFVGFLAAFGSTAAALTALISSLMQSLQCLPLMERARPILQALPETDTSRVAIRELMGDIRVDGVTFRYAPDGPLILDSVSFAAAAGDFVALVGPSGSGKSTLLRLLLGFEVPESGTIEFDGKDLSWLDVRQVRAQIGTVLQSGKLMAGSLLANILGSSQKSLEDAWEAARMAGLAEDIEQLPMGMQTVLPQGATTLSGGQRQRLLIARALVRQPRILIFDEATSALDNRTQAIVSESLNRLRVTRIVIAHRLSTIARADRIVVLDRGRVVEVGQHDELVARGGVFAELARRQLLEDQARC